jgi:hypothetical protein
MNDDMENSDGALPAEVQLRVDAACDRFEAAWRTGQRPRIEDYLDQAADDIRQELLRQLILVDIGYRQNRGDRPRLEEYQAELGNIGALLPDTVATAPHPAKPSSLLNDVFIVATGDPDKRFDIPPGQTTVGRSADANIVLAEGYISDISGLYALANIVPPERCISRLHALFQRDGKVVWLTDLNSKNHTYVNDRQLESNERVMLYPGDQIRFWKVTFAIHGNWSSNLVLEDDDPDIASANDALPSVPPAAAQGLLADQRHVGFRRPPESDWHP